MLRASIGFFIFGLVAYILGAYNVGGISMEVGKLILITFLVISLLGLLITFVTGRGSKQLT